jgi:hypothetical protein
MGPLFSGEITARTVEVKPVESWKYDIDLVPVPIVTELHWKLVNGRLNAMMSISTGMFSTTPSTPCARPCVWDF